MDSWDATHKFCDHVGLSKTSYIAQEACWMITDEAESIMADAKKYKMRKKWSDAVEEALARMIDWYDNAPMPTDLRMFVAGHRRSCIWTTLFAKEHKEKTNETVCS